MRWSGWPSGWPALIGAIVLAWCSQSAAQARGPQPLTAASSAGEVAYAQGDFEGALQAFERAYAAQREPRMLFRIGDAADKLGLHARAATAFEQYLRAAPGTKDRVFVESRLRDNRAALATGPARPSAASARRSQPSAPQPSAPMTGQRASLTRAREAVPLRRSPYDSRIELDAPQFEPAPAEAVAGTAREARASDESMRLGPWWLWAGAGTVVVAGIVIAALALGSGSTSPDPLRGNLGSAVQTLARP